MAGWEDLATPVGSPEGGGWESLATPVGSTVPDVSRAKDITDAVMLGLQSSSLGLAIRRKLPDQQLDENAPWYHRLAAGVGGVVGDIPAMGAGILAGGAAGTGVGGPGLGTAVGMGAGGFAVPMALRDALVDAYSHNYATSWEGVWEIAKSAMLGATKGAVIGGVTAGAGKVVAPLLAPAGKVVAGAGVLGTELSALTATSAAVSGQMPTWQDFMDNAILLGGLKGAGIVAKGMRATFAATGKTPEQVVADAQKDPTIATDLKGEGQTVYHGNVGGISGKPDLTRAGETSGIKDEPVFWVTSSKKDAAGFGEMAGDKSQVTEFIINPRNPLAVDVTVAELTGTGTAYKTNAIKRAQAAGNDAVVFKYPNGLGDEIAVLNPDILRTPGSVPAAYAELAFNERIKAAVDADARPELVQALVKNAQDPASAVLKDPVRYEYITDRATAEGVVREVADVIKTDIEAQRRGTVTALQSMEEGVNIIKNNELHAREIGAGANSAEIAARALLTKGAAERTRRLAKALPADPAAWSLENKLQMASAIEQTILFYKELAGAGAEAARATNMMGQLKRRPDLLGDAETLVKLYERKGSMVDVAGMVRALKDPAQVQAFAEKYVKATTVEKTLEAWKTGILSGPQTHLANIMGNAVKWLIDVPETAISATITAAMRAIKGDPLSMAQYKARALAPLYGLQMGAVDAIKIAGEIWNQKGEHLEKADVYRTAIEGKVGDVIRTPFRLLQMEDAIFRTPAERAQAHIMAVDRVTKEGLHPDTAEYRAKVVEYTNKPETGLSDEAGIAAIKKVQDAGAEAVFSQRLGPRLETVQRAMAGHPIQFIVPFFRTPANLVSWAVQHTPGLNLLSARWREDFAAGGERNAKALARVVIGSGLAMAAYSAANDGLLTGGGLFDPEQKRTKQAAGIQPYSIKIGDKYYSYQRMEPVAKVLGLAADLVELMKATKDEKDLAKISSMLVLMFGNATISTTYLSGLSNAMQSLLDPTRYGENFLEQYATSLVPKIIGQTAAAIDPHKREVEGVLDAIQSQIPFLREKLMAKRDAWGEPVANDKWFLVMPVSTTQQSQDVVKNEAVRLQVAIADAPKYITEKGPFNPSDKRIELSIEARDVFKEVAGKNAMAILNPIVNAPDWKNIPDFAKAEIYKRVIEGTRRQGQYASLPPDAAERVKIREKLVNEVIKQSQEAAAK